jgi:hypothetical protein
MSDKLLKFLVTELLTVRVGCKKCGRAVVELSIDRLHEALDGGECRFCHYKFHDAAAPDPFNNLRMALDELRGMKDKLEVSFVLPAKD